MGESRKEQDRPCAPCPDCGAEMYEKFWGNGGWARTDKATGRMHSVSDCIRRMKRQLDEARALVEEVSLALHSPSDDPEHDIHSHAESLPALYRTACNSIAAAQDVISGYVVDRLALAAKEDGNG